METRSNYMKQYREEHKEESVEYKKQWNEKNKEKIAEYNRQWDKENRKKKSEYNKRYNEENREKKSERHKQYQQGNRGKLNIITQRYRSRKRKLHATLTIKQWEITKLHFNNTCAYCGKELPLAQEHFIALSKGGEYTHNNIVPACQSCNSSKNNRNFFEWYPKYRHYSKKREQIILKYLNYNQNNIQQLAL